MVWIREPVPKSFGEARFGPDFVVELRLRRPVEGRRSSRSLVVVESVVLGERRTVCMKEEAEALEEKSKQG